VASVDLNIEKRLNVLGTRLNIEDKHAALLTVDLRRWSLSLYDDNRMWSAVSVALLDLRLAHAAQHNDSVASVHRLMLGLYTNTGHWADAESSYHIINSAYSSDHAYVEAESKRLFAQALIAQKRIDDAVIILTSAEHLAQQARSAHQLRHVTKLRGELALCQSEGGQAAAYFEQLVEMQRKVRLDTKQAFGGLARARLLQGQRDEARLLLDAEPIDDMSAAEVWLSLGEPDKARERALAAYHWAWGEGEPYANWDGLWRARAVLKALNEPEPVLARFDPDKYERLPQEAEIIAFIEELEAKKAKKDADAKKDE